MCQSPHIIPNKIIPFFIPYFFCKSGCKNPRQPYSSPIKIMYVKKKVITRNGLCISIIKYSFIILAFPLIPNNHCIPHCKMQEINSNNINKPAYTNHCFTVAIPMDILYVLNFLSSSNKYQTKHTTTPTAIIIFHHNSDSKKRFPIQPKTPARVTPKYPLKNFFGT